MRTDHLFIASVLAVAGATLFGCATAGPLSGPRSWAPVFIGDRQVSSEYFEGKMLGFAYGGDGRPGAFSIEDEHGVRQGIALRRGTMMAETDSCAALNSSHTHTTYTLPANFPDNSWREDWTVLNAAKAGGGRACGALVKDKGAWVAAAVFFVPSAEQLAKRASDAAALARQNEERERQRAEQAANEDAKWREDAKAWRALKKKPPLPEAAHRDLVLAENAASEQRFEDALKYYEAGLSVEPLWPEARYNAALISAELKRFPAAVEHMRKYLDLSPDGADAQESRDKLIIWEENLPQARPSPKRHRGGK